MIRASRFLKNVTSNYVVTTVDAAIFILLTPFIVHSLGVEIYAVWVILQTIGFYLDFLDFGVPDAQVRQHAVLVRRKDRTGLSRLNGTVFAIYLAAGFVAVLAATTIALLPTRELFDIPASASAQYAAVLLLIGLTVAISFIETGIDGIFEGYQRYDLMNVVHLVAAILAAVAVFLSLAAGFGIVALALVVFAETALSALAKYFIVRRSFPTESQPRLAFDRETWRSIRGYSLWSCLDEFVTEGTAQFDRIFIPILLTSALVTPYSLIVALAAAIFVLAEPITDTFLPMASSRYNDSNRNAMTAFMLRGTRLVTIVTLPVTIVIVFFGQAILDLWIGAEYTSLHPTVLWFTAANFFFSTYLWTSLNALMGAGKVRLIFRLSLVEVALVLVLILSLVPLLGLPGLALAGLIGNVTTGVILFLPAACRLTTLGTVDFLMRSLLPQLLAAIPGLVVALGLARWFSPASWAETIAVVMVSGTATLASLLFLGVSRHDRARYYVTVRRLVGLG